MKWTDEMRKAVTIAEKEMEVIGGFAFNRETKVNLACNIVEALAKKDLIKKED